MKALSPRRRAREAGRPCASVSRGAGLLALALVFVLAAGGSAGAQEPKASAGDLMIFPMRVVLEGRTRNAEVTLVNRGERSATYRVSFVQLRMDEDGGTKEIEKPGSGEQFADGLVRLSPRQVTLEPGVAQTVRIQVRKPAGLAPGEYRSHLLFRAIPPVEPAGGEGAGKPAEEIGIRLIPIYGLSIPLIVRHGDLSASVTLTDLALAATGAPDKGPDLRFTMNRTGNQSVYGHFTVTFTPRGGKARVVGQLKGVAVWTPNAVRKVRIALQPVPGLALSNGALKVTYAKADKPLDSMAQAALAIP